MHHQPLLVVLRAEQPLELLPRLDELCSIGVRHVEIAWTKHPAWAQQVALLRQRYPSLALGAASIISTSAVEAVLTAGLGYAMAPILDPVLQRQATEDGLLLVPGVFSPSDVQTARVLGCELVKLFPAVTLGVHYWQRLRQPLGELPFCIAAGGLGVGDLDPWLEAGVDAVTLGAQVTDGAELADLAAWIGRREATRRD